MEEEEEMNGYEPMRDQKKNETSWERNEVVDGARHMMRYSTVQRKL